jgi:hypothetical protein
MIFTKKITNNFRLLENIKKIADEKNRKKLTDECMGVLYNKIILGFENTKLLSANKDFLRLQKMVMKN